MAIKHRETAENGFDDAMAVREVISGQKQLFRLLVQRYEQPVYGMGLSFFRNSEDAADFTQDVFLKAYRSLAEFEGRARFSTWLYRIAYNTAVNSIKRKKDYQSLAEEDLITEIDTPEHRAIRSALREAVREAVTELPERYRVCIDLYFFYERSYQEIESITGYPVNTIKSHVLRAKKLLREKLEDFIGGSN
ncbi:RNA polymerase subunit sigma-24 [Spirochaetia bacterium]|nr:RNA polymerase subunit sigma-24 [Spirochaetia bacterium]